MSGSLYLIAKIVLFMLAAAVIGYLIGRLTSRKAAEPLKRLADVDSVTSRAPSPSESASQAAELRRRLGVAYQTIRELEEKNVLLQEASAAGVGGAAGVVAAEATEVQTTAEATDGEPADEQAETTSAVEPEVTGSDATVSGESSDEAGSATPAHGEVVAAAADEPADAAGEMAMGPAERIRAAKQARDSQRSGGAANEEGAETEA